jgi:DNA adenine methylase
MPRAASDACPTPFIKWVGGKRSLLAQIRPHLPKVYGRLFEPFVGSAALFFDQRPKRATLSDNNARLVATYRGLRDSTDEVIRLLQRYRYDRNDYLAARSRPIDDAADAEIAAWFIYLNKTGYNGLYRVNSKNQFNVPFGRYTRPTICDEPTLRACAAALRRTDIVLSDFETTARKARRGDLVYFDPPYVPLSATSSFTSYTADGFGPDAQLRLRDTATKLAARGVHVVLSNSSARAVVELYRHDFDIVKLRARRSINSRADGRQPVTELLMKSRTF